MNLKIATIAPTAELERITGKDDFHLALAHLCYTPGYLEYYSNPARGYVILDNSAYEAYAGKSLPFTINQLSAMATDMKASELVMPDKLLDGVFTFEATKVALRTLVREGRLDLTKVRIQVVPQGHDFKEWIWCFGRMMDEIDILWEGQGFLPPVIAVAKIYDDTIDNGRLTLLQELMQIRTVKEFDVHMLGLTRLWQLHAIGKWLLRDTRHEGFFVRSLDTAKAVEYGIARKHLTLSDTQVRHREDDFFGEHMDQEQLAFAFDNIQTINKAAAGTLM